MSLKEATTNKVVGKPTTWEYSWESASLEPYPSRKLLKNMAGSMGPEPAGGVTVQLVNVTN